MKKIFSLFVAVLFAFAANADVIKITPTSPQPADNLRLALNGAKTGDIIEMGAGTYEESKENYIAFTDKEVTVRAAEGAEVILKPKVCVRVKSSSAPAKAEFIGIKFDCSAITDYSNVIVPAGDGANQRVVLRDCEFYGWAKNAAMIQATSARRLDSIVIDNCYFHNCEKCCVFAENANLVGLEITNSTFANIAATYTSDYYAAPIFVKATTGKVLVDHCTFYNVASMSVSYGVVTSETLADVTVSNSIFMLPATEDKCATNLPAGGNVKNTLTYNYDNWQDYGHFNTATVTACVKADPKFVDAANGDYTLGEGSPALEAGTDGKAIGDPRWFPKAPAISAVPTEAAPVPTWPADQVKSLYSDTYTFAPASLNSYNEGWWDWPTLTEENIDGNKFLHYNGRMTGMIGWQFGDIAASIMEYIHVDIWPSANTTLKMGPTSPNPTVVAAVELTVEAGKWNSIDIPVSALLTAKPELNLADIFQNQFTNYGALTDLSIDNVYFYRTTPYVDETAPAAFTATLDAASYFGATIKAKASDESGAVAFTVKNGDAIVGTGAAASGVEAVINVAGLKAGTKYNLSVIASDDSGNAAEAIAIEVTTTAGPAPAPAPKTYKGLVKSFYSDVYPAAVSPIDYMQVWWKGAPISSGELAEGENVIFYGVADEGASFGWAFNQIDLTEYPYLHVSVYPLAAGTIEIYPVQQGTADEAPYHRASETLKANEWNELVYDFSALEMTKIQQIGWCNYVSAQGFFVDNFYFSKSKEEVGAADRRINAYGLSVAADGDNYTFSYTANIDGTEANIVFYQNGVEKDAVAIAAPKKGANQATIAKSDIPKGTNTWAVELKADQVFEFGKVYESPSAYNRLHVAVDNSPESDYFQRIYMSNNGAVGKGLFILNQDYSAVNAEVLTAGLTWGSPCRLDVDAYGKVWISDWADGDAAGVWILDPANTTSVSQFFDFASKTSKGQYKNAEGVEIGEGCPAVGVAGEGKDMIVYTAGEEGGTTLKPNGLNIYKVGQEDGSVLYKWGNAPSVIADIQNNANGNNSYGATSHGVFMGQNRSAGQNNATAYAAMFYDKTGTQRWNSNTDNYPEINGCNGGGLGVSWDEKRLGMIDASGNALIYDIAWTEDVPALTLAGKYAVANTFAGQVDFDYAGNLLMTLGPSYGPSAMAGKLYIYGLPTENNEVIVPAKKALVVEGTNETTAIEDSFVPAKVEKVILNGQVLIIRDGKTYNMMGQTVK